MTDAAPLSIDPLAPDALIAIEVWGDAASVSPDLAPFVGPLTATGRAADFGAARLLWWEPGVWLLRAPLDRREGLRGALAEAVGERGAVIDLTGAFARLRVAGPAARELMMIGGVFDAEHALAPEHLAGALIHHLPVRLDAIDATTIDVYVAPGWTAELLHHWRKAQARFAADGGRCR